MIYYVYIIFFFLSVVIYNDKIIFKYLKRVKEQTNNPQTIRDISLGFFVNGVFSVLNSSSMLAIFGYVVLTLMSLVGIINANNKLDR